MGFRSVARPVLAGVVAGSVVGPRRTIVLSGTLAVMCGLYLGFVARRIEPRPEDRDAEIAEGAGVVGFFGPGSYWPLGIGLAAAVTALGLAAQAWRSASLPSC